MWFQALRPDGCESGMQSILFDRAWNGLTWNFVLTTSSSEIFFCSISLIAIFPTGTIISGWIAWIAWTRAGR